MYFARIFHGDVWDKCTFGGTDAGTMSEPVVFERERERERTAQNNNSFRGCSKVKNEWKLERIFDTHDNYTNSFE